MPTPWERAAASGNAAMLRTFGVSITYTAPAGAPQSIIAVPEDGAQPDDNTSGRYIVFGLRPSDLGAAPVKGARVAWGGNTYAVMDVNVRPSDTDWARLTCERVGA